MKTLTYGQLPTFDQFEDAFDKEVPGGAYNIHRGVIIRPSCGPTSRDYTCRQLWEEIQRLHKLQSASAEDWISSILFTLGWEWV